MLDWLRQHKDNPYPNDDEKAMLIKQTGLTINQINYWFTNARRRILPNGHNSVNRQYRPFKVIHYPSSLNSPEAPK